MSGNKRFSSNSIDVIKQKKFTSEEKKALLEKFYQLPQPCSQRRAAALLGVSQPFFNRLIANSYTPDDKLVSKKPPAAKKVSTPRASNGEAKKRLTNREKCDILRRYEKLQPCTQKRAAALLGVPQSSLSELLKAKNYIEETAAEDVPDTQPKGSVKRGLRRSTTNSTFFAQFDSETIDGRRTSDSSWTSNAHGLSNASSEDSGNELEGSTSSSRKRTNKCRLSHDEKMTILEKYLHMQPCSEREAAKALGIEVKTLCSLVKRFPSKTIKEVLNSKGDKSKLDEDDVQQLTYTVAPVTKKHLTLEEKIKFIRRFDEMQPCSQAKAAIVFGIPYSTFTSIITQKNHLEEDFKNQIFTKVEILRKYDNLAIDTEQSVPGIERMLSITKDQLDNILANRDFLEREFKTCDALAHERLLSVRADVETALTKWYIEHSKEEFTWAQLMEKAKDLTEQMNVKGFTPSDKWLMSWKKRIHKLRKDSTGAPVLVERVDLHESGSILPALKNYHPDNVFNLDETGMYYRAFAESYIAKHDWITVVFACNMTGSEKRNLLVIGKSEAPMFFNLVSLPVEYKYNRDAQMTGEILSEYLLEWDRQLEDNDRNIALIIDSSGCHSTITLSFERIHLFYLPPSTRPTSHPLNCGIISRAKTLYRQKLKSSLKKLVGKTTKAKDLVNKMSLTDAMFMLSNAWEEVPNSVIIKAYSELVFPTFQMAESTQEIDEEIEKLNQLDENIQVHFLSKDELDFLDPGVVNEEYTIVQMEGVVFSEGDENAGSEVNDNCDENEEQHKNTALSRGPIVPKVEGRSSPANISLESAQGEKNDSKPSELWTNQDALTIRPTAPNDESPSSSVLDITCDQVLNESFFKSPSVSTDDSIWLNSQTVEAADPPGVAEVQQALSVIKRFLKFKSATLEDFTDYTQLESKVLSKLHS